jgi:prephenate dehydratase
MPTLLFLGPEGSFCHKAALISRSLDFELVAREDVKGIIQAVERGDAECGVVPIENSVDGEVTAHVDELVFRTANTLAVAEIVVPVSFSAFVLREGIAPRVAISHPVALAQCQDFIKRHQLLVETSNSTSAACQLVRSQQRTDAVALSSDVAGELNGLYTFASQVEDNHDAQTRFLVLSRSLRPRELMGEYRSWIALVPPSNRTGVLAEMLTCFAERQINLHSISSRPLKSRMGAYCFILTLGGWIGDETLRDALSEVVGLGYQLRVLGSYLAWAGSTVLPSIFSLGGLIPQASTGFSNLLPEI